MRSREPWDQGWRLFSVSIIPSATYCSAVWCPAQGLLPDHLGGLVDHTPWNSYPRSKCVIQYPISDLTYYFTLIQYPVSDQTLSGCTAHSERCSQQPNSCSIASSFEVQITQRAFFKRWIEIKQNPHINSRPNHTLVNSIRVARIIFWLAQPRSPKTTLTTLQQNF